MENPTAAQQQQAQPTVSYTVTVPAHNEPHESFIQKIGDGLKTAGIDVLKVVAFPLELAQGIQQD